MNFMAVFLRGKFLAVCILSGDGVVGSKSSLCILSLWPPRFSQLLGTLRARIFSATGDVGNVNSLSNWGRWGSEYSLQLGSLGTRIRSATGVIGVEINLFNWCFSTQVGAEISTIHAARATVESIRGPHFGPVLYGEAGFWGPRFLSTRPSF